MQVVSSGHNESCVFERPSAAFQESHGLTCCVPGLPGCLLVRSASVPNLKTASSVGIEGGTIEEQVQPRDR